jgi:uncharacterized protein YxjI
MHETLQRNLFFVREHVGMFRAANQFDVLDPATGQVVLHCREPHLGALTKLLRFTDYKRMTPFDVRVTTPDGTPVLTVRRGVSFFLSKVDVLDGQGVRVGGFKQKLFSIGGKFDVLDHADRPLCTLKGKWTGWDYRFLTPDREYAHVDKKWSGLGKELFTSADNYMLKIADDVPPDHPVRMLVLGAVLCIDMVLKE